MDRVSLSPQDAFALAVQMSNVPVHNDHQLKAALQHFLEAFEEPRIFTNPVIQVNTPTQQLALDLANEPVSEKPPLKQTKVSQEFLNTYGHVVFTSCEYSDRVVTPSEQRDFRVFSLLTDEDYQNERKNFAKNDLCALPTYGETGYLPKDFLYYLSHAACPFKYAGGDRFIVRKSEYLWQAGVLNKLRETPLLKKSPLPAGLVFPNGIVPSWYRSCSEDELLSYLKQRLQAYTGINKLNVKHENGPAAMRPSASRRSMLLSVPDLGFVLTRKLGGKTFNYWAHMQLLAPEVLKNLSEYEIVASAKVENESAWLIASCEHILLNRFEEDCGFRCQLDQLKPREET